ncbi:MAG: GLUG motif-containing protein, partial [Candidatus Saliniplasma sp.]
MITVSSFTSVGKDTDKGLKVELNFSGGSGTEVDPYQISNWTHLNATRGDLGANYTLINDLDETTDGYETYVNTAGGFEPIGDWSDRFTGSFDGNNYTISGLYINRSGEEYVGLFGQTGTGALVKNIGLVGNDITGGDFTGSLAGVAYQSTLSNSYSTGVVNGTSRVGGILGVLDGGSMTQSYSTADVTGITGNENSRVGGAVGDITGNGLAEECYATGTVTGGNYVGGFMGRTYDAVIRDSYAMGTVNGNNWVGGFAGTHQYEASDIIERCYSTGEVNAPDGDVGGFCGMNSAEISNSFWDTVTSGTTSSSGGTNLITDEMTGYSAQENMTGFDFIDTWTVLDGSQKSLKEDGYPILQGLDRLTQLRSQGIDLYAEGDGSESDPFQIADWTHMDNIRDNLSANFTLINDLDKTTVGYETHVNTTEGWEPLGGWKGSYYTYFTGSFNGQNYDISDLFINRPSEDHIGLFGYVGKSENEGAITNVTLKNIDITGDSRTGGLVGRLDYGSVSNSSSSGTVAGGYIGGGIVGTNRGTIIKSFASVDVVSDSSETSSEAGGLAGANHGTISDCYATGDVTGNKERLGGLAGNNGDTITNSYSVGKVNGESAYVGGLIGYDYGTVTNAYWDILNSDQYFSAAGTGLTTGEMTGDSAKENMTGFDFTNTWDVFDNGTWVSYPYLRDNPQSPEPGLQRSDEIDTLFDNGDGSESNPYQIENWYHLENVNANLSANYTVMNELNETTEGYHDVASELANDGSGFDPIGESTWSGPYFTGNFDGQGYQIKNIIINRSSTDLLGLFAYLGDGGYVSDTGVVDVNITGLSSLGALVGWSEGTVMDSWSSGDIIGEGTYEVGGLVGGSMGTIEYSSSTANVTAHSYVGGLVGGIYSYSNMAFVNESYAMGTVISDTDYAGGLVGYSYVGAINNCYATGTVNGTSESVGGLVGSNNDGTVNQSYSTGNVSGDGQVGGLVGRNTGTVNQSYSTGNVSGDSSVGGLVGDNTGTVSNSFWDMETSGRQTSAGGTGKTTAEMKTRSTFTEAGWNFDTVWNIKEHDSGFVSYPYLQNNKQDPAPGEEDSYMDHIEIVPSDDLTITAGETIDFNATAYNQYGHLITDIDSDFTWQNTDSSGLFTETTVGIHEVKASNNTIESDIINVTVEAAEANDLQVTDDPGTVTAGESFQVTIDVM